MWKTVREVVFCFSYWGWQQEKRKTRSFFVFRLDALALSVIATATWLVGWLAGWLGGWLGSCLSQPVLYQNDKTYLKTFSTI